MKQKIWWTDSKFNRLVRKIIDLQNKSMKHFKAINENYDNIKVYIEEFKKEYDIDEEYIWLFAENKVSSEDLETLIEDAKIIKKDTKEVKHEARYK